MVGGRTVAFATEISLGGLSAVFDHPGDDLGEIKPSADTSLVQAVYPEHCRTAGKEINNPGQ